MTRIINSGVSDQLVNASSAASAAVVTVTTSTTESSSRVTSCGLCRLGCRCSRRSNHMQAIITRKAGNTSASTPLMSSGGPCHQAAPVEASSSAASSQPQWRSGTRSSAAKRKPYGSIQYGWAVAPSSSHSTR